MRAADEDADSGRDPMLAAPLAAFAAGPQRELPAAMGGAGMNSARLSPSIADSRRYLIERVGSTGFLQLYADGFEINCPRTRKILAYHLSEAAKAGDDIIYDQTHRHGLEIKDVPWSSLVSASAQGIDPAVFQKIRSYFLQFVADHGNYSHATERKFVPQFGEAELKEAARAAREQGAFAGLDAAGLDAGSRCALGGRDLRSGLRAAPHCHAALGQDGRRGERGQFLPGRQPERGRKVR